MTDHQSHSHWRITEAQAERIADRRVMARLATDRAYKHAEDAEAQSLREAEIASEVWLELDREYEIT